MAAIQVGAPQEDVAVAVIAVLKAIADNGVDREVALKALDVVAVSSHNTFDTCNFSVGSDYHHEGDD